MNINNEEIVKNLKRAIDLSGEKSFTNHTRSYAIISDIFVGDENIVVKRLIKSLIDADAFKKISNSSISDFDSVCRALREYLIDYESLSEERAEMAIGWVCDAYDKRKPVFKPQQSSQTLYSGAQSSYSRTTSTTQASSTTRTSTSTSTSSSGTYTSRTSMSSSSSSTYTPRSSSSTYTPRSSSSSYSSSYSSSKHSESVFPKVVAVIALLCICVAFTYFIFWPQYVHPVLLNDDLYTPEMVKTFSGEYNNGEQKGEAVIQFVSCDENGKLYGYFEITSDGEYGKCEISAQIEKKRNNGNLVISAVPGQWIVQPDFDFNFESMTIEITNNYKILECEEHNINWLVA